MNFNDTYEILELLVSDAEATTFAARDLSSGNQVMLHVLPAGTGSSLLDLSRRHLETTRSVLEVSESKGKPFVVTKVIPEFSTLRRWLEGATSAPATAEGSRDTAGQSGEFTRMFGSPGKSSAGAGPEEALPATTPGPGEFTRMFSSPKSLKPIKQSGKTPPAPSWTGPPSEPPAESSWIPKIQWSDANAGLETAGEPIFKPSPPATPPPEPKDTQVSDFTRVVSSPRAAADSPKPVNADTPVAQVNAGTPAAQPAQRESPSYLPLILGFVILFLIAVVLVLYFALKGA